MSYFDLDRPRSLWGDAPLSDGLETARSAFAPVLSAIEEASLAAELQRTLPFEPIAELRQVRFPALRVPENYGGSALRLATCSSLLLPWALLIQTWRRLCAHISASSSMCFPRRMVIIDVVGWIGWGEVILPVRRRRRHRVLRAIVSKPSCLKKWAMGYQRHEILHHRLALRRLAYGNGNRAGWPNSQMCCFPS